MHTILHRSRVIAKLKLYSGVKVFENFQTHKKQKLFSIYLRTYSCIDGIVKEKLNGRTHSYLSIKKFIEKLNIFGIVLTACFQL